MTNFEWIASMCLFIWILMLAEEIPNIIGYTIICGMLFVYYLFHNDYFGG